MKISNPVRLFILMLFGGVFLLSSCQSEPKLIPRETLFGNPTNVAPQISPDGNMLAYLAPSNDVLNVWVRTIGQQNDRVITNDTLRGIRRYFWAADNKHVMYLQDMGGDENWRLYGVNLETSEIKDLTPYEKVQVQIVDRNKHFPDELLIAMNKENPQLFDVYHLNLASGELTLVANNPGNVIAWLTDADFNIRCAMASTPTGGFELWVRPNEKSAWSTVLTWDSNDALTSGPVSFTKDGKSLYLQDSRNVNAGRLVKMELESGNIEVIAQDPQYDVSNALIHPDEYTIQAVSFYRAREEWTVLDPSIQADFDAIAKLDRGDFNIIDRDNTDNTWVVSFMKDDGPISYYAFDRKQKKGAFLFDHRPELKKYELASMEPVSFVSRDGLTIHGYITFPKGKSKKNLPLVLNVHGGPWARDRWGINSEAQWLANRGYACLQVNFRGSTGYGKEFLNAGDKEWGGKMHNDLVDAVKWAVQQGYADSTRVAIYGGSYGGYAALVGATFTPDLFRCAVDIVGPSNLTTWITSIPPYWATFRDLLYRRVGHPETEAEFLKSRSPLFKVDQIKIPMLIAQGANDPRVPQAESEQIVAALKEKGIDHQYMLFPDEGHGFARPENRLKFYAAAEEFLAKHLGGRFEGEAAK